MHPPLLPRGVRLRAEPLAGGAPAHRRVGDRRLPGGRTSTLRRLGPFDPGAFLYAEDMDLCLRARAAGVPTVLAPRGPACATRARTPPGPPSAASPFDLLAARRRAVVAQRGGRALALDDAAQGAHVRLACRRPGRAGSRLDPRRELAQLAALRRARAARPELDPASRSTRFAAAVPQAIEGRPPWPS